MVVTFTDDEEDELNELLYFLNHKGRTDMKGSRGKVLDYEDLKINAVYRSVECQGEQVRLTNYICLQEIQDKFFRRNKYIHESGKNHIMEQKIML